MSELFDAFIKELGWKKKTFPISEFGFNGVGYVNNNDDSYILSEIIVSKWEHKDKKENINFVRNAKLKSIESNKQVYLYKLERNIFGSLEIYYGYNIYEIFNFYLMKKYMNYSMSKSPS